MQARTRLTHRRFKATIGLFIVSDRSRSTGCDRLFRDWFEHCSAMINDSLSTTRLLYLKDLCCAPLQQLEQHLKMVAGCYREHHQLLDVLNKIISSSSDAAVPSRAVAEACACAAALKVHTRTHNAVQHLSRVRPILTSLCLLSRPRLIQLRVCP